MAIYKVVASYTQWVETEIEADSVDDAYEQIEDLDLEYDYEEKDTSDFTVNELIKTRRKKLKKSNRDPHLGCYAWPNCDLDPNGCVLEMGSDVEEYGSRD